MLNTRMCPGSVAGNKTGIVMAFRECSPCVKTDGELEGQGAL